MLRERAIRLLIIILGFYSYYNLSFAQSYVSVPDTVIPRGEIYNIPVSGIFNQSDITSLKITFQFNARVIDVKSATGADSYIMKCSTPWLSELTFSGSDTAYVDISCDSVSSITNGIICSIDVEGLAGPDSITTLVPIKVFINGIQVELPTFKAGQLRVPGSTVYQQYPEGLGQNYPNPFSGYTFFPISIENATKIDFKIFTNYGQEVFTDLDNSESLMLFKETGSGFEKINIKDDVLEKGNYRLTFIPEAELASGSYFMVMQSDNGVYNKRFLYIK
jgi:hypothetical protein